MQHSERHQKDESYEDFKEYQEDECLDSDMEGSILNRPRPKKPVRAPAVPPRSEKRASKMLNDVMLELQSMDGSIAKDIEKPSIVQQTDPHELYLSSEEDASLSDYDDSLSDFEIMDAEQEEGTRDSSSRASSRKSQEVTARVVSFTLVKPQIIDIFCHSPPKRPASVFEHLGQSGSPSSPLRSARRPSPLKLYPSSIRRMSISSITSLTHSTSSSSVAPAQQTTQLPPRKSSRMANLTSLITSTKHTLHNSASHAFLHTDPFAQAQQEAKDHQADAETPTTPKTPTSMAAAAFKKGISRGLRARKPSMQKLSSIYSGGSSSRNESMVNLSQLAEQADKDSNKPRRKSLAMPSSRPQTAMASQPSTPQDGPLRYEDIMKNVIRAPPPQPIQSPKSKTANILLRRKSVKA
ncbi:hypothetical protein G7Y89_g5931 [Cudoniella acicularis]|uniref:Uncharacterized protein n=1 Tax=Cudoniella acicularis TaxID=354080 RepID=A0A8H4W2Y6_9HELO|nr:hypothetical protein G7Y89_g5931 [Cudoniella acicularis]